MIVALLTLEWSGRTIRLAQRHLDVYDASTGRRYHYSGGLPTLDLVDTISLLETGAPPEIQLDALIPADVASLVEAGHQLHGATAELSLYSGSWVDREVVVQGYIRDPRYQPGVGLVRLVLSSDPGDDSALYPHEDAVVSDDTHIMYDSTADGRGYPTIIGHPGVYLKNGIEANVSGSPVLTLDNVAGPMEPLLLAGHVCAGDILGAGVRIRIRDHTAGVEDDIDTSLSPVAVEVAQDLLGRDYWRGYLGPAAGQAPAVHAVWAPGHTLTAQWTGCGGIPLSGSHTTTMERAGDVLRWALGLTSLPVDWRLTMSAAPQLRDYILAGYWDERCSPRQWIGDQLLPILPVSLRYSSRGIYPVVWRWWAGADEATAHLEVGRSCSYLSGPEIGGWDERVSSVTTRYARTCVDGGTFRSYRTCTSRTPDRSGTYQTLTARRATMALTSAPAHEIEADMSWSGIGAGLACRAYMAAWARQAPAVTVRTATARGISVGDIVTLTWPAVSGVVRRPCLVTSRIRRGVAADLKLRISGGEIYR